VVLVFAVFGERFTAKKLEVTLSLGTSAFDKQNYPEAETLLRRSSFLAKIRLDQKSLCRVNGYLGNTYLEEGQYGKAEEAFATAIRICAAYGNAANLIADYASLGMTYEYSGDNERAEAALKKALDLSRQNLKTDDPQLATVLNDLGTLKLSENRYDEAEPFFRQAVTIFERTDSPELVSVYSNLGHVLVSEEKLQEAEMFFQKAIDIGEKKYGPDSPELAPPLNNLAMLYDREKRVDEARKLLQRAISNLERAPSTDPSRLALFKKNYEELQQERSQ
jgi:tetratricopeptide (TPR) repeat protein